MMHSMTSRSQGGGALWATGAPSSSGPALRPWVWSGSAVQGRRKGARCPFSAPKQRAASARRPATGGSPQQDEGNSQAEQPDVDSLRRKFFPAADSNAAAPGSEASKQDAPPAVTTPAPRPTDNTPGGSPLDAVNPIVLGRQVRRLVDDQGVPVDPINPITLGRQARRAFDEVWTQLSQLASPTKRTAYGDDLDLETMDEPAQAAATTVLVLGATGLVGRIVVRKLLLRGYKVRALVRRKPGRGEGASGTGEIVEGIPAAVKVVFGDVGDMRDCQEAVRGASKVVYCAGARSTFTGDLNRVEEAGVRNLVKAFQDECIRQAEQSRARGAGAKRRLYTGKSKRELADFSQPYHQARWNISFLGVTPEEAATQSERAREMGKYNQAVAEINDEENLVFEGVLYQRGAAAEVGAEIVAVMPGGDHRTASTEGLVLRLRGDGKQYLCVVKTDDGQRYTARFPTRAGYTHVRLPWDLFRAEGQGAPPLQPERLTYLGIRYEFRRAGARLGGGRGVPTPEEMEELKKERMFQLEVDWIKALPGGAEPDFILVSRAGKMVVDQLAAANPDSADGDQSASAAPAPVPALAMAGASSSPSAGGFGALAGAGSAAANANRETQKVVEFKRRGEDTLRLSGLGYTIVRPGGLVEEPGGYKAIVFDQGDRITESIAAADVADICLRALHEPAARNKTFDVCYEDQAEAGSELYELVAHVPDRSNSYLRAAVSGLVKNT